MKLVLGVGTNDAWYPIKDCPFYSTWRNMLKRCYHRKYLSDNPTYEGCSVCPEWLTFSTFRTWMEAQDWHDKCLDKDLLLQGNKMYSPNTCCFISQRVNKFLAVRKHLDNGLPIGVSVDSVSRRYRAQGRNFNGAHTYLGLYDSADEAHCAYLKHKHSVAVELSTLEDNHFIRDALLTRFVK